MTGGDHPPKPVQVLEESGSIERSDENWQFRGSNGNPGYGTTGLPVKIPAEERDGAGAAVRSRRAG